MELNDYNLKPYKNLNPYLDDTTERVTYEPTNSSELALSGNDIDNIIGDELAKGYDKGVDFLNFAKQTLVTGTASAKHFLATFSIVITSHRSSLRPTDASNDLS